MRAVRIFDRMGWETRPALRQDCELTDTEGIDPFLQRERPDCFVNCAAVSGLEEALDDPLRAHLVNAMAPAAMARACRRLDMRFIHLSTDYVLDGRKPGLKAEDAPSRPCCMYGESKREGELQTLEENPEAVILRTSWVCGNAERPSFLEQTVRRALNGEELSGIADKYSLPTDVEDLVRAIAAMADHDRLAGIFHTCSGGEPLTWHGYAERVVAVLAAEGALMSVPPVRPVLLAEASFFREPRPRHTAMDNRKLCGEAALPMPSADETIRRAVLRMLRETSAEAGGR